MMPSSRWTLSILLAVIAGTGAACRRAAPPAASADQAIFVGRENMAVAVEDTLEVGPAISGTLAAERTAQVRAEVPGTVVEVAAEPGQPVVQGQVLGRIDDTGVRDAFASSQAALRSAEISAGLAERDAKRADTLAKAGAIADRDREQAMWALSNAQTQLADARARMVSAEKELSKTTLRAPFSGVVSERPVNLGDVVQIGTELFTIVDPTTLKLDGTVAADALEGLRPGTPVAFSVGEVRHLTGRITRINPAADPATRQVRVTVSLPNTGGRLVAGLFAEGRVATSTRVSVVVPSAAVDRRGLRPFVVRVHAGKVERAEVELGLVDAARERMEVIKGLAPGDTLLLGGARGIPPGTPIRFGNASELGTDGSTTPPGRE